MGAKTELIEFVKELSEERAGEILKIVRSNSSAADKSNKDDIEIAILDSAGIWADKNIKSGEEYQSNIRKDWRKIQ